MRLRVTTFPLLIPVALVLTFHGALTNAQTKPGSTAVRNFATHEALETFFKEWRAFQKPPLKDGVPNYTLAAMAKQRVELGKIWKPRLAAMDISTWSLADQNDYRIVEAELHGLDFDHRVLKERR